jgi:hypothetical protein
LLALPDQVPGHVMEVAVLTGGASAWHLGQKVEHLGRGVGGPLSDLGDLSWHERPGSEVGAECDDFPSMLELSLDLGKDLC